MSNVIRGVVVNPEVIRGKSAYEIAVAEDNFGGTKKEWLDSLKGKSAYEIAVENGFKGSEAEWIDSITEEAKSARDEAQESAKEAADVVEEMKQNLTVDGETLNASFATVEDETINL